MESLASLSAPLISRALTGLVDFSCSTLYTARCSAVNPLSSLASSSTDGIARIKFYATSDLVYTAQCRGVRILESAALISSLLEK